MTWALTLLRLVPWQGWALAGILAVGWVYVAGVKRAAYRAGYDAAIDLVERANKASERKATEGEAAVIECHRLNRVWDREAGKCSE